MSWGIYRGPAEKTAETLASSTATLRTLGRRVSRSAAPVEAELSRPLRSPKMADTTATLHLEPERIPPPLPPRPGHMPAPSAPPAVVAPRSAPAAAESTRSTTAFGRSFRVLFTPNSTLSGAERADLLRGLRGAAIDPAFLRKNSSLVQVDHLGRILSVRNRVSDRDLTALDRARVASPTEVNSPAARETGPRTERDVLVQFMHEIADLPGAAATDARAEARRRWMSGSLTPREVSGFFESIRRSPGVDPALRTRADHALGAVRGTKTAAQYHDNLYGRHFDSAVADALVKDPPAGALASGTKQAHFLNRHLAAKLDHLPQEDQDWIMRGLVRDIAADRRPWFGETNEIDAFLRTPNRTTLGMMLKPPRNGIDLVKTPYLAVKTSLRLRAAGFTPPWMPQADEYYREMVHPNRSTVAAAVRPTTGFGLRLFTHPPYEGRPTFGPGRSWADAKRPQLEALAPFEKRALEAGHPIVNGASGSANILFFMNRHISGVDPTYVRHESVVNSLMFLTFDGGHSLNEVMAVEHALGATVAPYGAPESTIVRARARELSEFRLNYNDLPGIYADPEDARRVQSALDVGLDRTIDHFRQHSYYAQTRE